MAHKFTAIQIKRMKEANVRDAKRVWLAALKAKPCMDCGRNFPSECMDFDHRPGEKKLFVIGEMINKTKEVILQEIAKCDLVCACCHRSRTKARFVKSRIKIESYEKPEGFGAKISKIRLEKFGFSWDKIAEEYLKGKSSTELALVYGLSKSGICKGLNRMGIPMKLRGTHYGRK